jgi:hypothetical protein
MARIIICLMLFLPACASQVVRCDSHLQAINPPAAKPALSENGVPGGARTP